MSDLGQHKGYKQTIEHIRKRALAVTGCKHGLWKGDLVGFGGLHTWVRNHKPKPELCECCQKQEPYDVANISGEYKRDINDFQWLCRKCHMANDGRLTKLIVRINSVENKDKLIEISKKPWSFERLQQHRKMCQSEEHRRKVSIANRGRKLSETHKQHLKESWKRKHEAMFI
jgi:hypothetical protein